MDKTLDYYLGLPYTIELTPDPEEGWFVRVKELPGCSSQGDTAEEALEMIQDAMKGWLEVSLEEHYPIPEPAPEEEYSGKFVLRVPKSLHHELVEQAERESVSLNTYCLNVLAKAVGRNAPVTGARASNQAPSDYRATIKQYSAIADRNDAPSKNE
jgi:antitoxin HicB